MQSRYRQRVASDDQNFERLIDNAQSGKLQLTQDTWIEGMRRELAVTKAESQISDDMAGWLRFLVVWLIKRVFAGGCRIFGTG